MQLLINNMQYLDEKVPGIHSENSKYKFYSSKVILPPSKYPPLTATHLCQRLIQLSKHFWNSIVDIAIRALFDFSITSFRLLNAFPVMVFLIRSNRKKSQGPYQMNSMAVRWYSFFGQKFTDNDDIVRQCVIIVQNPLHF